MKKLLFIGICCMIFCGCENKLKPVNGSITLDVDNEYMQITALDLSEIKHENDHYYGNLYFISNTTQKYIDTYKEYYVRHIHFGFYNEKGNLIATEVVEDDCVYRDEYTMENQVSVSFPSKYPISEVKILKIVITNPDIAQD